MKNKKIKIGLAVALGSAVSAPGCASAAQEAGENDQLRNERKENKDSVRLEKRLRELATTKYSGELAVGAMCYAPMLQMEVDYTCPICGNVNKEKQSGWMTAGIKQMNSIVDKIREKGYDVVLDPSEFCEKCSGQEINNPSLIFKIRFSPDAPYHIAKSNIESEYLCVLEFVSGNSVFKDGSDFEHALHDNIQIIQKMTGLGANIENKETKGR